MKVISLLQPWATLVVIGAKKIETRSWNTAHTEVLLIHASKKMDNHQKVLCESEHFDECLKDVEELPLGSIIGKVEITGTSKTENIDPIFLLNVGKYKALEEWHREKAFGEYATGRYGWYLENPVQFKKPIPCKGSLSLWDFNERICLQCGCSENDACLHADIGPCWWNSANLCSHCRLIEKGEIKAEDVHRSKHVPFF